MNTKRTGKNFPPLMWVSFGIVGLEILGLAIAAVWMLVERPEDGPMASWGYGVTFAVVTAMFAGLLFIGARALWHGMRWGRGPVIAWQLLQFFTAVTMSDLIGTTAGWVVGLLSLLCGFGFITPAAIAVTSGTLRS